MANTTISSEKITTIILQGDNKSLIEENTSRKEAFLTPMPIYLNDSDQTDVFDFGGTVKTITLIGNYTGDETEQKDFIDSIQNLIQGHQDVAAGYPLTFTDDLRGILKIKVLDFESTKVDGQPNRITWTLKLVEASEAA